MHNTESLQNFVYVSILQISRQQKNTTGRITFFLLVSCAGDLDKSELFGDHSLDRKNHKSVCYEANLINHSKFRQKGT